MREEKLKVYNSNMKGGKSGLVKAMNKVRKERPVYDRIYGVTFASIEDQTTFYDAFLKKPKVILITSQFKRGGAA